MSAVSTAAGKGPLSVVPTKQFGLKMLRFPYDSDSLLHGQMHMWVQTKSARLLHLPLDNDWHNYEWCTPEQAYLKSGDWVKAGDWIIWGENKIPRSIWLGCISEILQMNRTPKAQDNRPGTEIPVTAYLILPMV
ncbi:hypothetical protein M422DRAFT_52422 [Sphaerobolus stellatus SS14]|uniref:Uncharacterized protein n=1 Tax=Sphaerobolus stellatus (strain SS14) TaxID=990650 RepID=A0A0C9UW49_SPHS4|nr:hypothetical protein M422DRAFT_52422 [Sphaerobolus stellatus SS14]